MSYRYAILTLPKSVTSLRCHVKRKKLSEGKTFVTVERMTMHELFAQYHIHRQVDLVKRVGLTKSYAHLLWHGHRKISRRMAERISAATGIPVADLITAEPPTPPAKH